MDALSHRISMWLHDSLAILLPVSCVACGQADRRICAPCRAQLEPVVTVHAISHASNHSSAHAPPEFLVASAGPFGGPIGAVVASAIHALKEEYRTGVAHDLAPRLRASVNQILETCSADLGVGAGPHSESHAGVLFVAPPSSRVNFQARGFEPIELLARRARIPLSRELRAVRARVDQTDLGVREREDNMRGSMVARRPLSGASVVLIDDLMTTGATLREMARAIRAAGGRVLGAATVAHTPRRHPRRIRSRLPENA